MVANILITLLHQFLFSHVDLLIILCFLSLLVIRVYDAVSGRELHDVQHKHDIETLDLSRSNSQRCISFTDKNHDLYVMQVSKNVTAPISIGNATLIAS